ncbi:MAG: dihydroorotate dehydrogenase electron transfer subunit [Spirochaetes bacterium]|nr:dihydroorotate dehydrogenase electron transfer subunit [Spirochaetota bacterium]
MRADLPQPARIVERLVENHRTVTLVLDTPLDCSPGQFAMLWLPGLDEKPFSISADEPLSFTVSRVGPFSEALHALGPGGTVWFRGPFGRGFGVETGCREPVLVGGGYGAAPLAFLARRLLARPNRTRPVRIHAVLGARTAADLLFTGRFAGLGCEVHPVTEDGTAGLRGVATDAARQVLAAGQVDRLFACGPGGMLDALAVLVRARQVPAELSREAYLRCGVGVCGACAHGDRLVCLDGPVFEVAP